MSERLNRREFIQRTGLYAGAFAASHTLRAEGLGESKGSPTEGLVAFRISASQWLSEARFEALLDFFQKYPGVADELAFFTSNTHPPLPLAEVERRAERLDKLIPRVRKAGMSPGINLLSTMGHHEENLEGSLNEPWQRVMDPHGQVSKGSFCPASPEFQGYVVKVYTALARTAPDFIWIDDDVRLAGHMPITYTCFCPGCMQRFSAAVRRPFTRDSLVAAFGTGPLEQRLAVRRQWLEHNRVMLGKLFELIEATVHSIKPGLPLGFMTGDRFYEGYGFAQWAAALAGPTQAPVRWRPGGGFYSDESLVGLVGKAHDIGRQVAQLPPQVNIIQSEIENFPYDLLRKSVETTVVEAAAHMAAGTTGTAFNVLSQRPDPLEEYEPMLRRIQQVKPFYRSLREALGRYPLVGIWPAWNTNSFAVNSADGPWPEGPGDALGGMGRPYVLGELGLPICHGPQQALVKALSGPGLLTFSRDELKSFFSGGVLMDLSAWETLNRMGLAGWTGVEPGQVRAHDAIEVLANHPLNGRFAGWSRDCRQSFWHEPATTFEATAKGVQILAQLTDYLGHDLGVSMTAFENDLGGRVVVMGYFPWSQMHNLAKSSQMKAVCNWLSRERLPARVESFARVHLWAREPDPNRLACVMLNASLDPAPSLVLRLAKTYDGFHYVNLDGEKSSLTPFLPAEGHGACVQIPLMKPWSVGLLTSRG